MESTSQSLWGSVSRRYCHKRWIIESNVFKDYLTFILWVCVQVPAEVRRGCENPRSWSLRRSTSAGAGNWTPVLHRRDRHFLMAVLLFLPIPHMLGLGASLRLQMSCRGWRCSLATEPGPSTHEALDPIPSRGRKQDKEHIHYLGSVARLRAQWGFRAVYKDLTVLPALKWRQAFRCSHAVLPQKWPRCPL